MTEKSPDDIFALFSRFDLDGDSYRVFPKKETILHSLDNPQPNLSDATAPKTSDISDPDRSLHAVTADGEDETAPASQTSRSALRSLCHHLDMAEKQVNPRTFKDLLKSSVFVHGVAGGVGVTTVSATLARLLSRNGRYCGIVNSQKESALPFFFGQQGVRGHGSYAGLQAASEPSISIIGRNADETNSSTLQDSDQSFWFEKQVSTAGKYLDHLIIDVQRGQEQLFPENLTSVDLIVAIPDVSSLVGARALQRTLSEKSTTSKQICVLNRFDASLTLHAEIRDWFTENFSAVFTLNRTDLVSEAHAEGLTVVDWAPQNPITADFLRLSTAVQQAVTVSSISKSGEFSLCS